MNLPPLPLPLLLLLLFMLLLLLLLVLEAAAALLVGSGACQQQQRALPLLLRPPPLDRNFASSFRSAAQVHLRRPKRPVQTPSDGGSKGVETGNNASRSPREDL